MVFADKIRYLDEPQIKKTFPQNFTNEIYWSSLPDLGPIAYESKFSIKFAVKGEISYVVNGNLKTLTPQTFMFVKEGSQVVSLGRDNGHESMSIFIEPALLSE